MRRSIRKEPYFNKSRECPSCAKVSLNFFEDKLLKCSKCNEYRYKGLGICSVCDLKICEGCLDKNFETQEEKSEIKSEHSKIKFLSGFNLLILALVLTLIVVFIYKFFSREISVQVLTPIHNLCSHFPSQKPETWRHIFSILNPTFPTVKSLTLLQGKDGKTVECLIKKLIMVYTNDNNIKIEDISFENVSQEVKDYGEVLEYYRPIVEKHGIFVTDLDKISANIARIFHSLCDEVSSPIKPSFFIFILRYNENAEHLNPSKRATTILKKAWQDLPSNELFPLISRVLKNVIDVIPEKQIKC